MDKHLKITLKNITNQGNLKGLESVNICPTYNNHRKYVYVPNNMLFFHCGYNGHLEKDSIAFKTSQ